MVVAAAAAVLDALVTVLTLAAAATGAGVPALLPPTEMFAALSTRFAAMLRFPETRMPASPASTVPSGAMRSTSPGLTPLTAFSTPMPPPVARPDRSVCTVALWGSMRTRVGEAVCTVLEEEPAAMSPLLDQMISLPPRSVKIRPMPMFTSSWAKMEIFPPAAVMMPGGASVLPVVVLARVNPPPGVRMSMSPPLEVRMSRERVRISPSHAPPSVPKRTSIAAVAVW